MFVRCTGLLFFPPAFLFEKAALCKTEKFNCDVCIQHSRTGVSLIYFPILQNCWFLNVDFRAKKTLPLSRAAVLLQEAKWEKPENKVILRHCCTQTKPNIHFVTEECGELRWIRVLFCVFCAVCTVAVPHRILVQAYQDYSCYFGTGC